MDYLPQLKDATSNNPTEGYGNCFPNVLVQQCRRPEVKAWLQKNKPFAIFNGQQLLRAKVTNFALKSRHKKIADLGSKYEEELKLVEKRSWEEYWNQMAHNGTWVDHMFVQMTAWYMELDLLILTTSSLPDNPFILISGNINNSSEMMIGPPLILGNFTNVHYQSLLPMQSTLNQVKNKESGNPKETYKEKEKDEFIYLHKGQNIFFRTMNTGTFECPYCKNLFPVLSSILPNFSN